MSGLSLLVLWIAATALHLGFATAALRRPSRDGEPRRGVGVCVSLAGSTVPWITLALFLRVFVIGGSSNVAQFAGDAGFDLWSLWCRSWPLMFFGNPIALIVLGIAALCPPYPPRHWPSFAARWCAVGAAALACHTTITYFPDA